MYMYISCKMFIININILRKLRKYLNNLIKVVLIMNVMMLF